MNNQLEALQNMANEIPLFGIKIIQTCQTDKRKTKPMFFLSIMGTSVSPTLEYDKMNHFLLGFVKASKLLTQ